MPRSGDPQGLRPATAAPAYRAGYCRERARPVPTARIRSAEPQRPLQRSRARFDEERLLRAPRHDGAALDGRNLDAGRSTGPVRTIRATRTTNATGWPGRGPGHSARHRGPGRVGGHRRQRSAAARGGRGRRRARILRRQVHLGRGNIRRAGCCILQRRQRRLGDLGPCIRGCAGRCTGRRHGRSRRRLRPRASGTTRSNTK